MQTRVTEVVDGIHQLSTDVGAPVVFNQYLVAADEPLLFHTGMHGIFPLVAQGISTVLPTESLRWISFGHLEADESGAINDFLEVAPEATVVHGAIGCLVSTGDASIRPPRPMADGEVLDIGGHRIRWIDTPHVPHGWDAGVMFDETTGTLFCGDLFTQYAKFEPTTTDDIAVPALAGDEADGYSSWALRPSSGDTVRRLAALDVQHLAPMHSSVYSGDCRASLLALADSLDKAVAGA
jgi:flavorubredoxin